MVGHCLTLFQRLADIPEVSGVAATLFGRGCPVACLDNAYGLIQP